MLPRILAVSAALLLPSVSGCGLVNSISEVAGSIDRCRQDFLSIPDTMADGVKVVDGLPVKLREELVEPSIRDLADAGKRFVGDSEDAFKSTVAYTRMLAHCDLAQFRDAMRFAAVEIAATESTNEKGIDIALRRMRFIPCHSLPVARALGPDPVVRIIERQLDEKGNGVYAEDVVCAGYGLNPVPEFAYKVNLALRAKDGSGAEFSDDVSRFFASAGGLGTRARFKTLDWIKHVCQADAVKREALLKLCTTHGDSIDARLELDPPKDEYSGFSFTVNIKKESGVRSLVQNINKSVSVKPTNPGTAWQMPVFLSEDKRKPANLQRDWDKVTLFRGRYPQINYSATGHGDDDLWDRAMVSVAVTCDIGKDRRSLDWSAQMWVHEWEVDGSRQVDQTGGTARVEWNQAVDGLGEKEEVVSIESPKEMALSFLKIGGGAEGVFAMHLPPGALVSSLYGRTDTTHHNIGNDTGCDFYLKDVRLTVGTGSVTK